MNIYFFSSTGNNNKEKKKSDVEKKKRNADKKETDGDRKQRYVVNTKLKKDVGLRKKEGDNGVSNRAVLVP